MLRGDTGFERIFTKQVSYRIYECVSGGIHRLSYVSDSLCNLISMFLTELTCPANGSKYMVRVKPMAFIFIVWSIFAMLIFCNIPIVLDTGGSN